MFSDTFAVIITGSVVAGKSTVARKVASECNVPLISEETAGNYYEILDSINPICYPKVLIEHCWIYRKWFILNNIYEQSKIILLNVDKDLLRKNFNKRLKVSAEGDYIKFDPVEQQKQIISDINEIKPQYQNKFHKIEVINIKNYSDYDLAVKKIVKYFD